MRAVLPGKSRYILPCAATILLPLLAGCARTMQVTVPANFHGRVTVRCTNTGRGTRDVQVDRTGAAEASCPAIQPTIAVTRAGQTVGIVGEPVWKESRDGEMQAVSFVID